MKVTKTTKVELTAEDIKQAIIFYLEKHDGIKVTQVDFHVSGESAPDDWRAERALIYNLRGATCE